MANMKTLRAQQLASNWFAVPQLTREQRRAHWVPVQQAPRFRGAKYITTTQLTQLGEIASTTRYAGLSRVDMERFFAVRFIGEGTADMPTQLMQSLIRGLTNAWNAPAMYAEAWALTGLEESGIARIGEMTTLPGLNVNKWLQPIVKVNADVDVRRLSLQDGRVPVGVGAVPVNNVGLATLTGAMYDHFVYMAADLDADYSQYGLNFFMGRGDNDNSPGSAKMVRDSFANLQGAAVIRARDAKRVVDDMFNVAIYTGDSDEEWGQFQENFGPYGANWKFVFRASEISVPDLVDLTNTHSSKMEMDEETREELSLAEAKRTAKVIGPELSSDDTMAE